MYKTFEHRADIGIEGKGENLEIAFEESSKALFSIMTEIKEIEKKEEKTFNVTAENIETLLIKYLNELLYIKDVSEMFFSEFNITIKKNKNFTLEGKTKGEKIDSTKHTLKTEVKAATYSQVFVGKKNKEWVARCIVDV